MNDLKKRVLISVVMCVFLVGACMLGGCSKVEHYNRAYIVANVKGSCIDTSLANKSLAEDVDSNAFVAIINADGNPDPIDGMGTVGSESKSTPIKEDENRKTKATMKKVLARVVADDPECDLLGSFDNARKTFNSSYAYESDARRITVLSHGFSTAGVIDMRNGMLFADPQEVISYYEDELPDLSGIEVDWFGLGATREPQGEPTVSTKKVLERFWRTVLVDGCGVEHVEFHDVTVATSENSAASYPEMSVIDLPNLDAMQVPAVERGTRVTLDSQVLYFQPGLEDFVDVKQATEVLEPYGRALGENPSLNVTIIGSTASDHDKDYLAGLSQRRAEAAASVLKEHGASDSQITCKGTGNWGSDHIYDWADEASNLLEPVAAAANRHITLEFN